MHHQAKSSHFADTLQVNGKLLLNFCGKDRRIVALREN